MELHQIPLAQIQPSQFYLSAQKLEAVRRWFSPEDLSGFDPVPVRVLCGEVIFTDGHTRAFAAYQAGLERIPLVWDDTHQDWEAYRLCVAACRQRGIRQIAHLGDRILPMEEYRQRWNGWCDVLFEVLELQRATREHKQAAEALRGLLPLFWLQMKLVCC